MPEVLPPNVPPAQENDTVPINVNLTLNLPRAQVAALGQQLTEAAKPPLQFASVDKVELLGIIPSRNTAADETMWKNLTPLAQQLVQSVEEAHNAIESAVNMASQQQAAQAQPAKAMSIQSGPPMQLMNVPQSMLTKVTQVQPSCGSTQAI